MNEGNYMRSMDLLYKLRNIKAQFVTSICMLLHALSCSSFSPISRTLFDSFLQYQKKISIFILPNLKLGFKFFLYTSSSSHTCIFFPIGQGSYSIVVSSTNIVLFHYYKFHYYLLYTNTLSFSFYSNFQNDFFFGILKQKLG